MSTHPLWRAFEPPSEAQLAAAWVGGLRPATTSIEIVSWTPEWSEAFDGFAGTIRTALGGRVIALEHVGSTAVPGLPAKPVIDIDLIVADPADEEAYVPALGLAGFRLVIREPDWEQHRCFGLKKPEAAPRCNLHVFGPDAIEPRRHRVFRDWLRGNTVDRDAYAALKQQVASTGAMTITQYNGAKAGLIYDIYEHALGADPAHRHDPHSR